MCFPSFSWTTLWSSPPFLSLGSGELFSMVFLCLWWLLLLKWESNFNVKPWMETPLPGRRTLMRIFFLFKFIKDLVNQTCLERYNLSLEKWQLSLIWSFTVSIFCIGGLIGSLTVGSLISKHGRLVERSIILLLLWKCRLKKCLVSHPIGRGASC